MTLPMSEQAPLTMAQPATSADSVFFRPRRDPATDTGGAGSRPSSRLQSVLTLGPVTIAPIILDRDILVNEGTTSLLFIPDDRRVTLRDGTKLAARAGDLISLPAGGLLRRIIQRPISCTAWLASRRFLGATMPSRSVGVTLPRSGSADALRHHVERLYAVGSGRFDAVQARAAAHSIREMLAAAAALVATVQHCAVQREKALLDRIVYHVDAILRDDITIASLCEAMACSRSAPYRASKPRGGLAQIVMMQRLMAVRQVPGRGDDRRPIAEIARAHGFADASLFSQRFRRAFGISTGKMRAATVNGTADGALLHSDTARRLASTTGDTVNTVKESDGAS